MQQTEGQQLRQIFNDAQCLFFRNLLLQLKDEINSVFRCYVAYVNAI